MDRRRPLLAALACAALAACGGGGATTDGTVDPTRFVVGVDHAYFPLTPGWRWVYEGEEDGVPRREEVRSLPDLRTLLGVACTGLEERAFRGRDLVSVSTEWFAQDDEGNVWKFGEESFESNGAFLVPADDSWVARPGGPDPWMAFAAHPRTGDRYEGYRPGGTDAHLVTALDATAVVPAGTFTDCLEIVENPDDPEDADVILYAAGVGRVSQTDPSGHVELVTVEPY